MGCRLGFEPPLSCTQEEKSPTRGRQAKRAEEELLAQGLRGPGGPLERRLLPAGLGRGWQFALLLSFPPPHPCSVLAPTPSARSRAGIGPRGERDSGDAGSAHRITQNAEWPWGGGKPRILRPGPGCKRPAVERGPCAAEGLVGPRGRRAARAPAGDRATRLPWRSLSAPGLSAEARAWLRLGTPPRPERQCACARVRAASAPAPAPARAFWPRVRLRLRLRAPPPFPRSGTWPRGPWGRPAGGCSAS